MDNQRDFPGQCFNVDANTAQAVDDYYEYSRIVGEDDGGKLFTPEQFEAYKGRMKPIRTKNRIFLNWVNPNGMECISVGPQSVCFCKHRYIQHQTDFQKLPCGEDIKTPCRHCPCSSFEVLPKVGAQDARCECRHTVGDHSVTIPQTTIIINYFDQEAPHFCQLITCEGTNKKNCAGFKCLVRCECGSLYWEHKMLAESVHDRLQKKKAVGRPTLYQAMGGLTGFTSLASGVAREYVECNMTQEDLERPVTDKDHPFLRAYGKNQNFLTKPNCEKLTEKQIDGLRKCANKSQFSGGTSKK